MKPLTYPIRLPHPEIKLYVPSLHSLLSPSPHYFWLLSRLLIGGLWAISYLSRFGWGPALANLLGRHCMFFHYCWKHFGRKQMTALIVRMIEVQNRMKRLTVKCQRKEHTGLL